MYRLEVLLFVIRTCITVAKLNCFQRLEEDNVSFCSCDPAIEDRSWSKFSFLEALMLCSMRCSQTASCVAYNFFNATNQCQLFNQTLNKFSVLPGCQYYLKNDKDGIQIKKPLAIHVVDELKEFYFNGNNISAELNFANANNFKLCDRCDLNGNIYVVAVNLLVSSDDDFLLTNETWKCTKSYYDGWYKISYDDSFWSDAITVLHPENTDRTGCLSPKAKWIIESSNCSECLFYCRKRFLS
ncbi:hypothetical protein HELRODRAFT_171904 [Helobdella robusta]|uniref:Apple domain-containing protein n=1 Tax=Helobdella robusta TaxID=6412 RepID=T1F4T5_HELRO|nr:hypothetical protein HELRODRAFT_171904 [Helobdella robusta]ESO04902.1 hypothetical protein HELRODRAFT_171904 [Helobdella robusta]